MPRALRPLPYPYGALEPTIDELTMRLHPDKHHAASVAGLSAALEASVLGDLDLRYQHRRAAYLEAWWNGIDWQRVAARYATVTSRDPGRERCRDAGGDHA